MTNVEGAKSLDKSKNTENLYHCLGTIFSIFCPHAHLCLHQWHKAFVFIMPSSGFSSRSQDPSLPSTSFPTPSSGLSLIEFENRD